MIKYPFKVEEEANCELQEKHVSV